jgi:hypothetical protein
MMWYKLINEYGTIFWSNRRIEGHLVLEEAVTPPDQRDDDADSDSTQS